MKFTEKDIEFIQQKGLTIEKVKAQIELFRKGIPFVNVLGAATVNKGILILDDSQKAAFLDKFETKRNIIDLVKFVPASGAATRMFKTLFTFLKEYNPKAESINSYINRNKAMDLAVFFVGLEKLPFFEEVVVKLHKIFPEFNSFSYDRQRLEFAKTILDEDRLNFSYYPKGLLPFHRYKQHISTAFEEHLFEAAAYSSSNNQANLHFTISEKHEHKFDEEFKYIEEDVEERTNTTFNISFSYQKQATDTIAVSEQNIPVRDENGDFIFRPSGHGALLENLNEINADIIFIKNIDNVVVKKYKNEMSKYKKLLAGVLLQTQEKIFKYAKQLENSEVVKEDIDEISSFLLDELNIIISKEFKKYALQNQIIYLKEKLNRPIRVCGMVKNEGEPGGGPFWVQNNKGVSLQIVESAQIDKKDKTQKEILKNATHFNPVDLVCGIKNFKGEKYNLMDFVDANTAFITMKTKTGKHIKALELPGLWNGGMADWNTLFVEVPLTTFNPVKTVNDLLKPAHQLL